MLGRHAVRTDSTAHARAATAEGVGALAVLGDVETFGIAVGDIMYDDLTLYPEYERAVQRVGVPFFQVVGAKNTPSEPAAEPAKHSLT